jgi:polysaccharide export outer membrane protein
MKRSLICLLLLLTVLIPAVQADNVFRNGDVFEMRLSGPPEEFTREFNLVLTVDDDSVNIPLIGRVPARGLSSSQLATVIETRLKQAKIFTHPTVNITNMDKNPKSVIVGGSVRAPGRQIWVEGLTLTGAISAAGGPSDFAGDGIKIVRGGRAQLYSRKAIRKSPSTDPRVEVGDIIEQEGD